MKTKPEKVDESMLLTMIEHERNQALSDTVDTINDQRIDANFSFANTFTSTTLPTTNMSKVKFFFTPSAVNTLVMHQSKIFCSNKETVSMNAVNKDPEIIIAAKQLESMVNETLHKYNDGFHIITETFRSAAVNKNGIIKVTWTEMPEMFEEIYENMNAVQLDEQLDKMEKEGYDVELVSKKAVKEIEGTITENIAVIETEETNTYVFRFTKMKGKVNIDVIPPEEFMINEDTTSIHNDELTRFVGHERQMYRGDVKVMFPDVDVSTLSDFYAFNDEVTSARHYVDDTYSNAGFEDGGSEATTKLTITESWIRADVDGDGYPEWRHVFTCGNTLLSDEEWFGPLPFASYTFFPIPHKFYGLSVYDRLRSLEETATGLMRSDVDMARIKNTTRLLAKEGTVDRRNLQSGKTGVIPVASNFQASDVMVVPTPNGASNTTALMAELRKQVIGEIGIDPISGQVSSDIEKSGNDAVKTAMAIDNASVKIEGYSRRFADDTLATVVWLIATELTKHSDSQFVKDLTEVVTPTIPFLAGKMGLHKVISKSGIKAKVGLGHQTSQQKIQAASAVSALVVQLETNPSPALYNIIIEMLKGFGYEQPELMLGSLDEWVKKQADNKKILETQTASQAAQAQATNKQLQIQQATAQETLRLQQQDQEFKHKLLEKESNAKIALMTAQAEEKGAKTGDILTDTTIKQTKSDNGDEIKVSV